MKEPTFTTQGQPERPLSEAPEWLLAGAASGLVPFIGDGQDNTDEAFTRYYAAILLRERSQ